MTSKISEYSKYMQRKLESTMNLLITPCYLTASGRQIYCVNSMVEIRRRPKGKRDSWLSCLLFFSKTFNKMQKTVGRKYRNKSYLVRFLIINHFYFHQCRKARAKIFLCHFLCLHNVNFFLMNDRYEIYFILKKRLSLSGTITLWTK